MINFIQIIGLLSPSIFFIGVFFIKKITSKKLVCILQLLVNLIYIITSYFFSINHDGSFLAYYVSSVYIGCYFSIFLLFPIIYFIFLFRKTDSSIQEARQNEESP